MGKGVLQLIIEDAFRVFTAVGAEGLEIIKKRRAA